MRMDRSNVAWGAVYNRRGSELLKNRTTVIGKQLTSL